MRTSVLVLVLGLFCSLGLAQPNNSPAMLGDIRAEYKARMAADSGLSARIVVLEKTTKTSLLGLDSAIFKKLLDTLKKVGDRRWVNMPSWKHGVFAKLQARIDSLVNEGLALSDEYATDLANLTERVDKHAVRLNNSDDAIVGLGNKVDGNSERTKDLETIIASEAFSDEVDTDDFTPAQRAAYEKICNSTAERHQKSCTGEKCPYQGCKKSN